MPINLPDPTMQRSSQSVNPLEILRLKMSIDAQREDRERQEEDFVVRGLQAGLPLDVLLSSGGNSIQSRKIPLFKEMEKRFKQDKTKQEQATSAEQNLPNLSVLGQAASPTGANVPRDQLSPQVNQAQQIFSQNLIASGGANNPELLQQLGPAIGAQRLESQGRLPSQLAAVGTEQRHIAQGIRADTFKDIKEGLSSVLSRGLAGENIEAEKEILMKSARTLYEEGLMTRQEFNSLDRRAMADAQTLFASQARAMKIGDAQSRNVALDNAHMTAMLDPLNLTPEQIGILAHDKAVMIDPARGGKPLYVQGWTSSQKDTRTRIALIDKDMSTLKRVGYRVVQEAAEGKALTGVFGTKGFQEWLRIFGQQTGAQAEFLLVAQNVLINTARLGQDARLSDFDLALWMAGIPNLIDMRPGPIGPDGKVGFHPQAMGRFAGMENLINTQRNLPIHPDLAVISVDDLSDRRARYESDPEFRRRADIIMKYRRQAVDKDGNFDRSKFEGSLSRAMTAELNLTVPLQPLQGENAVVPTPEEEDIIKEIMGR